MNVYQLSLTKDFSKLFARAIEEAFQTIFRNGVYEEILDSMTEILGVSYRDLIEDPSLLHDALQLMFGDGAMVIESAILLRLSRMLGVEIDASEGFTDAVLDAKLKYEFELTDEDFDIMSSRVLL